MKKTRNIAVLLIALVLSFSVLCAPAYAVTAQYSSTQDFVDAMNEEGYKFTLKGVDQEGDELVITNFDTDNGSIEIRFYFDQNCENTNIRVWNVIDYNQSDFMDVLVAVDKLNSDYNYVRFYTDDYDDSVTAALDLIYRDEDVDDICMEALYYVVNIVEEGLAALAPYDK